MFSFKQYLLKTLNESNMKLNGLSIDYVRDKRSLIPFSEKSSRQRILNTVEDKNGRMIQILYGGDIFQGTLKYDTKWSFKGIGITGKKGNNVNLSDIKYLQVVVK